MFKFFAVLFGAVAMLLMYVIVYGAIVAGIIWVVYTILKAGGVL